ncbi:MAG: phosphoribosylaminoimidazolesuccinocarboxamide synthase [Nitrososphaerota archaeon]|nr:phosphoribosylaminoimidazolesuccinocarboxamide synthase [Candidatus Bathyarchaeota archaeon]MDW8049047.1 phosphoribosylaminoimidazolesuccinocarboxamide synthase [Nitrososphaerota archaeon]
MEIDPKKVLLYSDLPYKLLRRGKVRDIYDLGDNLLIFSTDRISAFDVVLPNGIPYKGESLNLLSIYWFEQTEKIVPNHIVKVVDSRSVLVRKADPIRVEFIVRGYLYGSAWERYSRGEEICGVKLPPGLRKAEKLPNPILTPTTKADVGHDVDITMDEAAKMIGRSLLDTIEDISLKIYSEAAARAESRGIIIADTKFEFGICDGELFLIDELLTPDSSRFWPKDLYTVGQDQPSFDKQFVRDYLTSIGWNKQPPAPNLPDHIIIRTAQKYIEAYERLTGMKIDEAISKAKKG